jgi:hypothetical protein
VAASVGLLAAPAGIGAPKVVLISLDGATPRLVDQYLASGALPADKGLGLLQKMGIKAALNETTLPSLTAVGHIAIATGSTAARNNVVANSFHLVASPLASGISGFGAPIGGYCKDCNGGGPGVSPVPTADPIWVHLLAAGRKVVTATWPGGDGVDVMLPGAATPTLLEPASRRTVTYTVPFGSFAGVGAQGFGLTAADFGPARMKTLSAFAWTLEASSRALMMNEAICFMGFKGFMAGRSLFGGG